MYLSTIIGKVQLKFWTVIKFSGIVQILYSVFISNPQQLRISITFSIQISFVAQITVTVTFL